MGVTIREVAEAAGVSIATVSHVINRTRYVKPELVQKVEQAIKATGYIMKESKGSNLLLEKKAKIVVVAPQIAGTVIPKLITSLTQNFMDKGYIVGIYLSSNDISREKMIMRLVIEDKSVAGIVVIPCNSGNDYYSKICEKKIPIVFMEQRADDPEVSSIVSDNLSASYLGTKHLLTNGHEIIMLLLDDRKYTTVYEERLKGYQKAITEVNLKFKEDNVITIDLEQEELICEKEIAEGIKRIHPTAVLACGNRLTLILLKTLQKIGMEWPKDISVVGFEDEEWCDLIQNPLTTVRQDICEIARRTSELLLNQILGKNEETQQIKVPVKIELRKSTQMIGKGPFGENAISPEELTLSQREIEMLRNGHYKVGISFHYGGTAWEHLHESGIRDLLGKYGIAVTSVTDANFDAQLQILQLEGLRMQKVDAIIAIPVNDVLTADEFKVLSRETKLVFISNVPRGMNKDEYASCVSVNERENGYNAGVLMGKYFQGRKGVKIGIIAHGSPFYGTQLRDAVAKETIESYDNLNIIAEDHFYQMENAYDVCKKMITEHPDIEGLYISWDEPALQSIRALKELKRTDIKIISTDLDYQIAGYLAEDNMVVGLSAQRPYEQGKAVAMATMKALLGEDGYQYIGVPPYQIQSSNLIKAWKDIFHEHAPEELIEKAEEKFT